MLAIIVIFLLVVLGKFISLWFQAFVSGTPIPLFNIIGMSLRKIPPRVIVNARITLYKAGLKDISVADLETHYLAGGHIPDVVSAMIAADKANIPLDWRRATAIDLAGRDLRDAVQTSVNPKVIDCPSHGSYITGVAKDGIQINVRARVTVRTNIAQLVGGQRKRQSSPGSEKALSALSAVLIPICKFWNRPKGFRNWYWIKG